MTRNRIADLRKDLFETLQALKDKDKPMDLERARAISEVAQTIINSAKVEVDLVKAVKGSRPGSLEFFGIPEDEAGDSPVASLPTPGAAVSRRENRLNQRMPWPKDHAAVDPFERKLG